MASKPAARYYPITRKEIEDVLFPMKFELLNDPTDRSKKSWPKDIREKHTSELVYGCRVAPYSTRLCVRVYSAIWLEGQSRGVGEDAIRVVMAWLDIEPYESGESEVPLVRIVGTTKRVHRIKTWADNLRSRICNYREALGPTCPQCNRPTVERLNKINRKKFWACIGYVVDKPENACRYTCDVKKSD